MKDQSDYSACKARKGSYILSEYTTDTSNRYTKGFRKCSQTFSESTGKYKTEICEYWRNQKKCPYGFACSFAHGNHELREKDLSAKYKTKPCTNFTKGSYCPYGNRCQFVHQAPEKIYMRNVCYLKWFTNSLQAVKYCKTRNLEQKSESKLLKLLNEQNDNICMIGEGQKQQPYTYKEIADSYGVNINEFGPKPRLYSL